MIHKKFKHKNFTLLELMIVIAIITILASLLLPSLGKAKNLARQIQCLNNFKQLGTATMGYTMDNNDYWVPCSSSSGTQWWHITFLPPYLSFTTTLYISQITAAKRHPFACPVLGSEVLSDPKYTNAGVSLNIGYNIYLSLLKVTKYSRPSKHFYLGDSSGSQKISSPLPNIGMDGYDLRHFSGFNALYVDMHANLRKFGTFNSTTSASPFWRTGESYANMRE